MDENTQAFSFFLLSTSHQARTIQLCLDVQRANGCMKMQEKSESGRTGFFANRPPPPPCFIRFLGLVFAVSSSNRLSQQRSAQLGSSTVDHHRLVLVRGWQVVEAGAEGSTARWRHKYVSGPRTAIILFSFFHLLVLLLLLLRQCCCSSSSPLLRLLACGAYLYAFVYLCMLLLAHYSHLVAHSRGFSR